MVSVSRTTHSLMAGANFSFVHLFRSGAFDVSNTSFETLVATSNLLELLFSFPLSAACREIVGSTKKQAIININQFLS